MLKVHDVGVHRHTDRHDQARDPGERERESLRGAEPGDDGPQQCPGDQQRHDRHDTEVAIIGDQIDRDEQHADQTGEYAGVEGILTEGGTHDTALLRGEFERQGTEVECQGEVLGLLLGERAGDRDLVALEVGGVDARGRLHEPVDLDGNPPGRTRGLEGIAGGGDHVEVVDAGRTRREDRRNRPALLHIEAGGRALKRLTGQALTGHLGLEHGWHRTHPDSTLEGRVVALLQDRRLRGGSVGGEGPPIDDGLRLGQRNTVEIAGGDRCGGAVERGLVVEGGLLEDGSETELGGLTDKVDRTLLILDAGDLDEDRLALAGHLRLADAKTVDTISDDVDRLVERLLGDLLAVGQRLGFEHDGCPALQVEAEQRLVARREGVDETHNRDHDDPDDVGDLTAHVAQASASPAARSSAPSSSFSSSSVTISATAPFEIFNSISGATSSQMTLSSTSAIAPWMPEFVTTVMPASSDRIRACCSFIWRCCGRMRMKYMTPSKSARKIRLPMRFLTIVNGPGRG